MSGKEVKKMKVHLVPSFHYDNSWHMSAQDYAVFAREKIIKAAVDILKKEEDFSFTIDHLPSLESFLEKYPEEGKYLREEMRKGRVEIVGPMYTQSNSLTVGGESLVRQCLYGAKWIEDSLEVKPFVEWLTDVYGFCNQLPQILKRSGVDYLVIALWWVLYKGQKEGIEYSNKLSPSWDFVWEGIDGSRIVVHNSADYGELYLPGDEHISSCPCSFCGGHDREKKKEAIFSPDAYKKTKEAFVEKYEEIKKRYLPSQDSLFMHMGGDFREPHPKNISLLKELGKETDLPEIVLSTPTAYFKALEKSSLPVVRDELNPMYKGRFGEAYYETKTWIKQLNRQFEYKMARAESLASMAHCFGKKYPAKKIENAYKPFLFYQHHDPFIGCIPRDEYDLLLKKWRISIKEAEDITRHSTDYLLQQIRSQGEGIPLPIFNSSSWPRTDIVQIAKKFAQGNTNPRVENSEREALPIQTEVIDRHPDGSIQRAKLSILAQDIPACGYEVLRIVEGKGKTSYQKGLSVKKESGLFYIENEFYRLQVNQKGQLQSFYDKQIDKELIKKDSFCGNEFILEEDLGCFCYIESTGKTWPEEVNKEAYLSEEGSLFCKLIAQTKIEEITVRKELIFYAFKKRIDFLTKVHLPDGQDKRLRVIFPLDFEKGRVVAETPFAYAKRREGISPVINWVDYSGDGMGLVVFNRGIPSYEAKKGNIYLNLIKGLSLKDPMNACLPPSLRKEMIEKGDFEFNYAVQSHAEKLNIKEIVKTGYEFNMPLLLADSSSTKQQGKLPSRFSFLSLGPENLVIHTVKKAEQDDALVVRIYETEGKPTTIAQLRTSLSVKSSSLCNLLELEEKPLETQEHKVEFSVKAHEIVTLKLKIRGNSAPGPA